MRKIVLVLLLIVITAVLGFSQVLCTVRRVNLDHYIIADTKVELSWIADGVGGVVEDYDTEYKLSSSSTWQSAGCGSPSCTVSGLSPGTWYDFRSTVSLTCNNDGSVVVKTSNVITVLLKPAPPVLLPESSITTSGFVANWQLALSATEYRLDVSDNNSFSSFVIGYENLLVNSTSQTVSGLASNKLYYYRIRAVNASGTSVSSTAASISTLPVAPVATSASAIATSSFIANWNAVWNAVSEVTSYHLDVATDNSFTSILPSYNNLVVNATSQSVSGLSSGIAYYYRVRAANASGSSGESNIISLATLPVTLSFSGVTTNSFTLSWDASVGATSYRLDISTDLGFGSFVTGFNNLTVMGTSKSVTGVLPDTKYYCRIRSVSNLGTSVNSNPLEIVTLCDPPDLVISPSIATTAFTLNWSKPVGALSYRLDVATDQLFTSMLTEYNNMTISGTAKLVTGLSPGTTYYCRVRASSTGGISRNSLTQSVLTLPAAPQNFRIPNEDKTSTTVKAIWDAVTSATAFELEVSTSETFNTFVAGYNPKIIGSTDLSHIIVSLAPSTVYYLRLRARNATGVSADAKFIAITLDPSGGTIPIKIENPIFPSAFDERQTQNLSITVSNGLGEVKAFVCHRRNSTTDYVRDEMNSNGTNQFSIVIANHWVDDFGMQFYFEARDEFGHSITGNPLILVRAIKNATIPLSRFGKSLQNYHIISLPQDVAGEPNPDIETLFLSVMKKYDPREWRMVKYEDGDNVDFEDGGLKVKKMERGQGYWFISKAEVSLDFGTATTYGNHVGKPFELTLKKGWNQIGNPFPYDLSWEEILEVNGHLSTVDAALLTYDHENISLVESNELKAYSGGFVHAEEATTLLFPTTLQKQFSGGRKKNEHEIYNHENWTLPILLSQENMTNAMVAIGMKQGASDGKDRYDLLTPPRFERYLEFNLRAEGYENNLTRSIVAPHPTFTWSYQVEHNGSGPVKLSWDKTKINQSGGQLILHDLTNHILTDMNKTDQYIFHSDKTNLELSYNQAGTLEFQHLLFGVPYPNPFQSQLTIPFDYSIDENYQATALLTILDILGRKVWEEKFKEFKTLGFKEIHWTGLTDGDKIPEGQYLYRLKITKNGRSDFFQGKLIKNK